MSSAGTDDDVRGEKLHMRRKCGCVKNIEEIKELLRRFPTVPPCSEQPPTPNVSPASGDEECELDNYSYMIQTTIPCDVACEKIFRDKSQRTFHGKNCGTCYSSDKVSATPCPPAEVRNQWTHYGERSAPVKERTCGGYKYNPQPSQPEKEAQPQSQWPLGYIYNRVSEPKPKAATPCEASYDQALKDTFKSLYNPSYTTEKNGPCPMDVRVPAKYARGPQPARDRFPEDLDAVKYGDLDKGQSRTLTKLMVNMLRFIQLLLTFIAILIYYCIFCYMHLIYFALSSAVYFHKADAAMKTTIVVVTVTSLVIALNLLMKFEKLVGMV